MSNKVLLREPDRKVGHRVANWTPAIRGVKDCQAGLYSETSAKLPHRETSQELRIVS